MGYPPYSIGMPQDPLPSIGLVKEEQLFEWLGDLVTPKKFAELRQKKLIPYVRLGHRSYLYDPQAVLRAIRKLTVKEIA
jgi:hypothetical protein